MTKSQEERLGIVETEVDNTKQDIVEIKDSLHRIEAKLDAQSEKYATKDELKELKDRPTWAVTVLGSIALFLAGLLVKAWGKG